MRLWRSCLYVFVPLLLIGICPSFAQMKGCKCHSKQPAMRHMHEIIGFTNCGNCHSGNENLMSGNRNTEEVRKGLEKRFSEDKFCLPCHETTGAVKKEALTGKMASKISDSFYCPRDKQRFPAGAASCPKCGGHLINVSATMERSSRNPSNATCMECHLMNDVKAIHSDHRIPVAALSNCLGCHKGHNDCGSCHH